MFLSYGRGCKRLTCSHREPTIRPRGRHIPLLVPVLLVMPLLLCACLPPVVRVKVPNEDIIRANQVAQEADLSFARKDFYAALIKYLEAGRLNPNSEYINNKIGITYSQLKFYDDAISAFQRSIGLNSKYPYALNNLGTVHFANGNKKSAEKYFKKAISVNPNIASFHVNLGTLYFERKLFDKGMAEWRKGLAIDPTAMGRSEGISLAAAGNRGKSSERSYFMARLYASMGDVIRAIETLQQALNAGFTNIAAINTEIDFDPIRNDERFKEFMRVAALLTRP